MINFTETNPLTSSTWPVMDEAEIYIDGKMIRNSRGNVLEDPFAPIADMDEIFDDEIELSIPGTNTDKQFHQVHRSGNYVQVGSNSSSSPLSGQGSDMFNASDVVPAEILTNIEMGHNRLSTQSLTNSSEDALEAGQEGLFWRTTTSAAVSSTESSGDSLVRRVQDLSDNEDVLWEDKQRSENEEKWYSKFKEIQAFKRKFGHCMVPHAYRANPTLARWAKRQRYQYKLFREGKHSSMTDQRVTLLEELGFVWDPQTANWEERFRELENFRLDLGHVNVPSTYPPNQKLAMWVKCQRRQYKLLLSNQASSITEARIEKLNKLGFVWVARQTIS